MSDRDAAEPFADLAATPVVHFTLWLYAAIVHVIEQVSLACGSPESALARHPFLGGYFNELAERGLEGRRLREAEGWWLARIAAWEARVVDHLPLRALREALGLDASGLMLLLTVGLLDEDARFGAVFEGVHGSAGARRPTVALLTAWWADAARDATQRLLEAGILHALNPDAPRMERVLECPPALWDAIRGEQPATPAVRMRHQPVTALAAGDALILPDALAERLGAITRLLAAGQAQALIVRGARQNGRRAVVGAVARALGRGTLEIEGADRPDDVRWRLAGPLATLLNALPVVVLDVPPSQTVEVPALRGGNAPVAVVLGRQGGVRGAGVERAVTVGLDAPDIELRRRHWLAACGAERVEDVGAIAERFRLNAGAIRRVAPLATTHATLGGRSRVTADDVRQAAATLEREALDALASRVAVAGDWGDLAVDDDVRQDLEDVERRCRHRERLPAALTAAAAGHLNCGVRALFSGASGTGKTLAARLLASVLGMDLYRVDFSAVVNKYIGETEKSLNQIFSCAEELDVMLLLDEGDALLTRRTAVQTSNDRYANLETNYLLQRLETFEGIVIVTTNASEHIDEAFQRRMDVIVEFRPPEAAQRWLIWRLHLPHGHAVDDATLEELAERCALSGGQIRNAVLHAVLLALDGGGVVTSTHVLTAVHREYRKAGAACPLPAPGGSVALTLG